MDMYRLCYKNAEFKHFIYGDKSIDIDASFSKLLADSIQSIESYVVLYKAKNEDSVYTYVGFCNFLKHQKYPFETVVDTFAFNGGILPSLFNSGLGIYACVSLLKLFFERHPLSNLYASTFKYNFRSARMLSALGFNQMKEDWYVKNHFILTKENFNHSILSCHLLPRLNLVFEV